MNKPLLLALAVATGLPLGACATDTGRYGYGGDRYGYESRDGRYAAERREARRDARRSRHLGDNDVIYRDRDGRYYCKRSDGTTGAVVGAISGGILGNIIAPGGSKTLGTILGAAGGALAGQAIDKSDVRCE